MQLGSLDVEWVAADLNAPESFVAALRDCDYVIHTANPYVLTVEDPQRDLVDPAVSGTLAVLEAALANSVQRAVLTSSFAAVSDEPAGVFTEADWNTKSSVTRNPYYYSKAAAEKAAWDFAAAHQVFEMVVINPSYVLGPLLVPGLNVTSRALVGLVSGLFPAVLDLDYPIVDVRDVARAHRLAMKTPEAHGRYLCAAEPGRNAVWSIGSKPPTSASASHRGCIWTIRSEPPWPSLPLGSKPEVIVTTYTRISDVTLGSTRPRFGQSSG